MKTEYLNQTPKGCQTCIFRKDGLYPYPDYWQCGKMGIGCHKVREIAISNPTCKLDCDIDFSGWRPIPPKLTRRSLRKWLYDLFLA